MPWASHVRLDNLPRASRQITTDRPPIPTPKSARRQAEALLRHTSRRDLEMTGPRGDEYAIRGRAAPPQSGRYYRWPPSRCPSMHVGVAMYEMLGQSPGLGYVLYCFASSNP